MVDVDGRCGWQYFSRCPSHLPSQPPFTPTLHTYPSHLPLILAHAVCTRSVVYSESCRVGEADVSSNTQREGTDTTLPCACTTSSTTLTYHSHLPFTPTIHTCSLGSRSRRMHLLPYLPLPCSLVGFRTAQLVSEIFPRGDKFLSPAALLAK